MEYTQEQAQDFREEFRQRRRRQWRVALVFVLLMAAFVLARKELDDSVLGLPPQLWLPLFLAVLAGAVVFSLRNWRCPACNGYLGRGLGPRFCPRCGVALQ